MILHIIASKLPWSASTVAINTMKPVSIKKPIWGIISLNNIFILIFILFKMLFFKQKLNI